MRHVGRFLTVNCSIAKKGTSAGIDRNRTVRPAATGSRLAEYPRPSNASSGEVKGVIQVPFQEWAGARPVSGPCATTSNLYTNSWSSVKSQRERNLPRTRPCWHILINHPMPQPPSGLQPCIELSGSLMKSFHFWLLPCDVEGAGCWTGAGADQPPPPPCP